MKHHDDWPQRGVGTEGSGSSGPGPSGVKISNERLLQEWRRLMADVCYGRATETRVNRARFNADLKRWRENGHTDERILEAMRRYAKDIEIGRARVDGRPAWGLFVSLWPRYSKAPDAPVPKKPVQRVKGVKPETRTWSRGKSYD